MLALDKNSNKRLRTDDVSWLLSTQMGKLNLIPLLLDCVTKCCLQPLKY